MDNVQKWFVLIHSIWQKMSYTVSISKTLHLEKNGIITNSFNTLNQCHHNALHYSNNRMPLPPSATTIHFATITIQYQYNNLIPNVTTIHSTPITTPLNQIHSITIEIQALNNQIHSITYHSITKFIQ